MKRYLIPILIILVLTSGLVVSCAPDLPEEEEETLFALAHEAGYGWGYQLTAENKDRTDIFWTPPDKVDKVQKLYPKVNILDFYIPKGYWKIEDVANAQFPDGTPFNNKQKEQAIEANNWGFYSGFLQGSHDCLEGKPDRYLP